MLNRVLKRNNILSFAVILLAISLWQCSSRNQIYSKATIKDNTDWKIIRQPGYEGPSIDVDVLKLEDIDIRVEVFNGTIEDNVFTARVVFTTKNQNEFQFNPSLSFVKLNNNRTITAKGLRSPCQCQYNLNSLRSAPSVKLPVLIDEKYKGVDGFMKSFPLFFDVYPPSVEDEFSLHLKGLTKAGVPFDIPIIYFRKSTLDNMDNDKNNN